MATKPEDQRKIFVENAYVLNHHVYEEGQRILRLRMPQCAQSAKPGQFIYLQCDTELPMRRPYSILNVCAQEGWVDLFYQVVGKGSRFLAKRKCGDSLSSIGPIGNPFQVNASKTKPLLLGGGVGMPPILFLAHYLYSESFAGQPITFLASERPIPFDVCQSSHSLGILNDLPAPATLTMLEEKGMIARLCSCQDYPGYFKGRIDKLVDAWLLSLSSTERSQTEIFACGPAAMLKAVAALAKKYQVACQVCLEEYMACGVGGCAGCTVHTVKDGQPAMQRVCVDGPVFNANELYHADNKAND